MLTVIAQYTARESQGDDVAAILGRHVVETRNEPGCITFIASRSIEHPERFVLFEQYVDEAAFESHRNTAHFVRYVQHEIVPLLEDRSWGLYAEVRADDPSR